LFLGNQHFSAHAAASKEYQVKAVFLYNFVQFTEWPADAFSETNSPIVIGILGDDPFAGDLDKLVRGEKVNSHPLVVQHYRQIEEINACQVLFISQSEAKQLGEIFARLKNRSILTVGDMDGFAQRGGMIRFVTENNKIRFRINVAAANAANLSISSKLLRTAEIVGPGSN
jgi:hypothetical protein